MAVSTINPWSAGAVVLDQRPFLAFYERQMAREQAKNDALENYFKGLGSNITSAGMRSQDVPGLLQMNKAWQDHYIQNKDAILHPQKDNGKALNEYNSGYQNQLALMNESKGAQKKTEKLGELKFNKDFQYVFDDPDILDQIKSHELPIGDPKRKDFDITTAMLPPKPLTAKDREEYSKYIVGDTKQDKIPGAPINVGNFQTQTPITHQYSKENKDLFGARAADFYDSANRDWKADANNLFKEVQHNMVLHNQLNSIYQRHYGKDVDTPRDAFIAKTILDHDVKTMEYQKGEDKWGLTTATAALHHRYAEDEIKLRDELKNKGADEQNSVIDELYNGLKEDAKKNPANYYPAEGGTKTQYQIKATTGIKKVFAVPGDKGHLIYPDEIRFSDNTVVPIFYNYDKGKLLKDKGTGNISVDKSLSQPILESEFKERWKKEIMGAGAYSKQLNKGGGSSNRTYNINGTPYTHEELKKLYPEEKIKEYLDAGIIK